MTYNVLMGTLKRTHSRIALPLTFCGVVSVENLCALLGWISVGRSPSAWVGAQWSSVSAAWVTGSHSGSAWQTRKYSTRPRFSRCAVYAPVKVWPSGQDAGLEINRSPVLILASLLSNATHVPLSPISIIWYQPMDGDWCLTVGKVTIGLVSRWQRVTDTTGSRPRWGRWAPAYTVLVEYLTVP